MTGDDVINAQQQDGRLRDRQEGGQRQVTARATDQCQVSIDQRQVSIDQPSGVTLTSTAVL